MWGPVHLGSEKSARTSAAERNGDRARGPLAAGAEGASAFAIIVAQRCAGLLASSFFASFTDVVDALRGRGPSTLDSAQARRPWPCGADFRRIGCYPRVRRCVSSLRTGLGDPPSTRCRPSSTYAPRPLEAPLGRRGALGWLRSGIVRWTGRASGACSRARARVRPFEAPGRSVVLRSIGFGRGVLRGVALDGLLCRRGTFSRLRARATFKGREQAPETRRRRLENVLARPFSGGNEEYRRSIVCGRPNGRRPKRAGAVTRARQRGTAVVQRSARSSRGLAVLPGARPRIEKPKRRANDKLTQQHTPPRSYKIPTSSNSPSSASSRRRFPKTGAPRAPNDSSAASEDATSTMQAASNNPRHLASVRSVASLPITTHPCFARVRRRSAAFHLARSPRPHFPRARTTQ